MLLPGGWITVEWRQIKEGHVVEHEMSPTQVPIIKLNMSDLISMSPSDLPASFITAGLGSSIVHRRVVDP